MKGSGVHRNMGMCGTCSIVITAAREVGRWRAVLVGERPSRRIGVELLGRSGVCGLRTRGRRLAGHLAREPWYFGVELFGDVGGGRVMVGGDRAGDRVVGDAGAAVRHLLDEDGDRRIRPCVGHVPGHLTHGDRVPGDEPD
jgi:hypothetical protein